MSCIYYLYIFLNFVFFEFDKIFELKNVILKRKYVYEVPILCT